MRLLLVAAGLLSLWLWPYPTHGSPRGQSDRSTWPSLVCGLAVEAAVVLPSNPWVTDISFRRYGLGVLAAATACYASARLWDDRGASFWSALHGAAVGGFVGGFAIFLAKKLDFPSEPQESERSYFYLDPSPWNAMVYAFVLIAPPLGAALGIRHWQGTALINLEEGRLSLGLPSPVSVPDRDSFLSCCIPLLQIHLDGRH